MSIPGPSDDWVSGEVVAFDAHVGLGTVRSAAGDEYMFHCVEIADGSRDIPVGAAVTFRLMTKLGRPEAASLTRPGA